jgi:hypothetical protein
MECSIRPSSAGSAGSNDRIEIDNDNYESTGSSLGEVRKVLKKDKEDKKEGITGKKKKMEISNGKRIRKDEEGKKTVRKGKKERQKEEEGKE